MSVKVAIRVRPFNEREKKLGSELCVKMHGQTVMLVDDEGKTARKYNYDYAIWSHDGFVSGEGGYLGKDNALSNYWDQHKVYSNLGTELLENAVKGYHCCLFAYGQTGSGKSYSIFGYGNNKGIVPMICDSLFDESILVNNDKRSFTINISMLEIYNEKIQDLLVEMKDRPRYGLKVHENPKIGVFVKGLKKMSVESYEMIENVIAIGNKNKTIGSTLMNKTSSRSHTVIRIELHQKEKGLIKTIERFSCINLVDLAGSEKVGKTGATGDRLKEACSINKSLMTLGIVIKQLVKKQNGGKTIISYRDSVLTRILQNALGGNSKTTMICAISPSRDNYEETVSTLRYANEAKRIKNNATINESEVDKMIRELQDENKRLKEILMKMQGSGVTPGEQEVKNILCQIEELDVAIREKTGMGEEETMVSKEDPNRMKTRKMVDMFKKKMNPELLLKAPHLINLNEDMMQSGNIIYNFLETPRVLVGRNIAISSNKEGVETIVLNSAAVSQTHASLIYEDGKLQILIEDELAALNTSVNGVVMVDYQEGDEFVKYLEDLDRIIFGTSSTYLVRIPAEEGVCGPMIIENQEISWDMCQMEKAEVIKAEEEENKKVQEEETKQKDLIHIEEVKKLQEMIKLLGEEQEKMQETKRETTIVSEDMGMVVMDEEGNVMVKSEGALKKGEEVTKADIASHKDALLKELVEKEANYERDRKLQKKEKKQQEVLEQQVNILKEKMIQYFPQVVEANLIAEQLKRQIEFVPFIAYMYNENKNVPYEVIRQVVKIKVINNEQGYIYIWSLDTFDNRLTMIRDAMNHFYDYNEILYKQQEDDPFWDPHELIYFAEGVAKVKDIIYRFDLRRTIKITTYEGEVGSLEFSMTPCDEIGQPIDEEDLDEIDNPEDLIENDMPCHFMLRIHKLNLLRGTTLNLKYRVQCELLTGEGVVTFETEPELIRHLEIPINWSKLVLIPKVTNEIINYYIEKLVRFNMFIENTEKIPKLGKLASPVLKKEKVISTEMDFKLKSEFRPPIRNRLASKKPAEKKLTRTRGKTRTRRQSKKTTTGTSAQNRGKCRVF